MGVSGCFGCFTALRMSNACDQTGQHTGTPDAPYSKVLVNFDLARGAIFLNLTSASLHTGWEPFMFTLPSPWFDWNIVEKDVNPKWQRVFKRCTQSKMSLPMAFKKVRRTGAGDIKSWREETVYAICKQQRCRSACESTQSDQYRSYLLDTTR